MRALGTARTTDETGAVAAIVAVVMALGVLLGMSAFVVDAGRVHLERRVVQQAADAAAAAIAQQCAERSPECATAIAALESTAGYADANSIDGRTDIQALCGRSPLPPCGEPSTRALDCRTVPAALAASFARVITRTRLADGGTALAPVFAGLAGEAPSSTMTACAQAAWGKAASVDVQFPFAMPICQFDLTGTPTVRDFASNDPLESCTVPTLEGARSYAQVIKGFSYIRLPGADGMCASPVRVRVRDILEREPSTAQLCGSDVAVKMAALVGIPIWMPVVTTLYCSEGSIDLCKTGQGSFRYQVASFVRFTMRGFKLQSREGGMPPPSGWAALGCTNSRACIHGGYSIGVAPGAPIAIDPTLPSLGLQAVQPLP